MARFSIPNEQIRQDVLLNAHTLSTGQFAILSFLVVSYTIIAMDSRVIPINASPGTPLVSIAAIVQRVVIPAIAPG